MKEVIDRLVRYCLSCVRAFEMDSGEILAAADAPEKHPGEWSHENYRYAAGLYLALYLADHPANPLHRDAKALARYVELADRWVRQGEAAIAEGRHLDFSEWPPLIVARGLERLGGQLDAGLRERWTRFAKHFAEHVVPQPFFFTAPNHEAWKLAVLSIAARVLKRKDLAEAAVFKAGQIIRYQTPEGFWEEGRHHGPSMKYNSLMLGALAVVAEETGSREVREAAARLARFMARWCYPDGVLAGVFDGRQSTSPGYFGMLVPGLDLAPEGAAHVEGITAFWERAGWLDAPRAVGPSNWYAHFGMPFAGESLLYYARKRRTPVRRARLPLAAARGRLENHTKVFDGVMQRSGPFIAAVSGQLSDVPKDNQFIYRLERQSRVELWHERASVVVGGGHSLVNCVWPLYNVWAESGWGTEPGEKEYPHSGGDAASPAMALRRSKYYPRATASGAARGGVWVELVYAHATVRFEILPAKKALTVSASWKQLGLEQLRLALPVVLWRTARATAGGRELPNATVADPALVDFSGEFVVETPLFGTRAVLAVPREGASRAVWPLEPVRTYGKLFKREGFESFFRIALLETVLDRPKRDGRLEWKLRVE